MPSQNVATRDDRTNRLVISNGEARVEEVRVLKAMDLEQFYGAIKNTFSVETPILPPNCVYYQQLTNEYKEQMLLCEVPPNIHEVTYSSHLFVPGLKIHKTGKRNCAPVFDYKFKLAFPYVYFLFRFKSNGGLLSLGAFVSKEPIKDKKDSLGAAPFLNLHNPNQSYNKFCTGDISVKLNLPLRDRVKEFINGIFFSKYNIDLPAIWPKEVIDAYYGKAYVLRYEDVKQVPKPRVTNAESYVLLQKYENAYLVYLQLWEELSTHKFIGLEFNYQRIGTVSDIIQGRGSESFAWI